MSSYSVENYISILIPAHCTFNTAVGNRQETDQKKSLVVQKPRHKFPQNTFFYHWCLAEAFHASFYDPGRRPHRCKISKIHVSPWGISLTEYSTSLQDTAHSKFLNLQMKMYSDTRKKCILPRDICLSLSLFFYLFLFFEQLQWQRPLEHLFIPQHAKSWRLKVIIVRVDNKKKWLYLHDTWNSRNTPLSHHHHTDTRKRKRPRKKSRFTYERTADCQFFMIDTSLELSGCLISLRLQSAMVVRTVASGHASALCIGVYSSHA